MMSRATLQDQTSYLAQGAYPAIMRQHQDARAEGDHRPSRLLQMRDDYQRRILKEKEERMVNMYETNQKKNLDRAGRVTKGQAVPDEYPKSKLRQPGYMQQHQNQQATNPSVRDLFRERREMEAKGGHVPPINRHFKDARPVRTGSGNSYKKNSAGVDRANPLAPIQARHSSVNSAPIQQPLRNKTHIIKPNTNSPDFDSSGHVKVNQRLSPQKPSPSVRGKPTAGRGISSRPEKMSDFQQWQMEQNRAREERLKKLNMRAPLSGRESRDWEGDYEYEEAQSDIEEEDDHNEELHRQEQELLQRIAHQQAELQRLRKEREEEEELEREEAERLRKQQEADRERRRRQQQEEARRRREEEALIRREEEEQQRAVRARQERQRFEARLDLYEDAAANSDHYNSQPNSQRDYPFQPNSHRENPYQPNSYRSSNHQGGSSTQATPKFTPKPPSEGTPRRPAQPRKQPPPPRRNPAPPVEDHEDIRVSGPGVDFYAQAVDEEQPSKVRLVSCKVCGRKFAEDRIQKHQGACKNAHKKREVYDPTEMRTEGTDMAKYIRQGAHKKEPAKKKKADWRRQHEDFISNIRYAKQMTQMEQKGVSLKDLPPPPPSHNPDLVPCPHCGRTFNEQAAERHIARCQDIKTRPVANNRRRR